MRKNCLNCGSGVSGDYCPVCGQDTSVARLNIRQTLSHAAGHFFNLDAVVPRTVLDLTRNPGKVAREYVDGRRNSYVQPFRYCLTAVALLMLVYALVGRNAGYFLFQGDHDFSPAMLKFQIETMTFVLRHLNAVIFAALPLQALVLKILFRRSRYNYAEVMSFTLFVMGHIFLLNAILNDAFFPVSELQFAVRFLLQTVYLIFATIGFFGENRLLTIFKSVLANILNTVAVAIMVLILITPRFVTLVKELKAEKAAESVVAGELKMKSAQFILYVANQQASRDFYTTVLGREPILDVPGMTEFQLVDGSSLGLMPETGIKKLLGDALPNPAFGGPGIRAEVYLVVEDPKASLERAVEAGAQLLSECQERDWSDLAGYCLDVDGYVLGFAAPLE